VIYLSVEMTFTKTPSGCRMGSGVASTEMVCFLRRTQERFGGRFNEVT